MFSILLCCRRLALSIISLLHLASGASFIVGRLLLKGNCDGSLDEWSIQRQMVNELDRMVGLMRAGRDISNWNGGLHRLGVDSASAASATTSIRIMS